MIFKRSEERQGCWLYYEINGGKSIFLEINDNYLNKRGKLKIYFSKIILRYFIYFKYLDY